MKPRHLVLTDIGGDPDDAQSLVRLLVHSNLFDLEGIIPELWTSHHGQTAATQMELVHDIIAAYGQVRANLSQHAAGYPTEGALHGLVQRGKVGVPMALDRATQPDLTGILGPGLDTAGSDWIIRCADRPDPRPLDISVWGGTADLAQALWQVRATRPPAQVDAFVARLRVHAIEDQDDTGPWIRAHFPRLCYVLSSAGYAHKLESVYRGMFIGGDETLTSRAWIDAHVRQDHGPLGALYPPETWTGPNPHSALKEGDTPSWFYFMRNGLKAPSEPGWGGWGGRFAWRDGCWRDAPDTVQRPDGSWETSGRATVWRWRAAYQAQFAARMDWCVRPYAEANHPPLAVLNGDGADQPLRLSAAPGDTLTLDAAGSVDPDGRALFYRWWVYAEAGSYGGEVRLTDAATPVARLAVPRDAGGATVHVILEVTNDGAPALTAYRRAVVAVVAATSASP
jgi:hypothetical protein